MTKFLRQFYHFSTFVSIPFTDNCGRTIAGSSALFRNSLIRTYANTRNTRFQKSMFIEKRNFAEEPYCIGILTAGTGGPEPRLSVLSCIVTTALASGLVSGVATYVTTSKD